ncbi:hypothetical protein HYV11_02915 [Candidatus Dependentiae bacterium]|nr:hypothetical protein [Candidatus Dependentiae bacterium]
MNRFIIYYFFLFMQNSILISSLPMITIYIHGSQNATKLLSKNIWYCKKGLHHISALPESSLFVKDAQTLQAIDKNRFNLDHYYIFGWSGKIDFDIRKEEGISLYKAIKSLLHHYYQKDYSYPMIRIISHSHGGNVALHLIEEVVSSHEQNMKFEMILMACPVQKITESFINHSSIIRSIILYSTFDLIQRLDFYTYEGKRYWPKRTFQTGAKNCYQILLKVNQKRLAHTDFCHSVVRYIPEILEKIDNSFDEKEYNIVDSKFIGYNGFNLIKAISGSRKK